MEEPIPEADVIVRDPGEYWVDMEIRIYMAPSPPPKDNRSWYYQKIRPPDGFRWDPPEKPADEENISAYGIQGASVNVICPCGKSTRLSRFENDHLKRTPCRASNWMRAHYGNPNRDKPVFRLRWYFVKLNIVERGGAPAPVPAVADVAQPGNVARPHVEPVLGDNDVVEQLLREVEEEENRRTVPTAPYGDGMGEIGGSGPEDNGETTDDDGAATDSEADSNEGASTDYSDLEVENGEGPWGDLADHVAEAENDAAGIQQDQRPPVQPDLAAAEVEIDGLIDDALDDDYARIPPTALAILQGLHRACIEGEISKAFLVNRLLPLLKNHMENFDPNFPNCWTFHRLQRVLRKTHRISSVDVESHSYNCPQTGEQKSFRFRPLAISLKNIISNPLARQTLLYSEQHAADHPLHPIASARWASMRALFAPNTPLGLFVFIDDFKPFKWKNKSFTTIAICVANCALKSQNLMHSKSVLAVLPPGVDLHIAIYKTIVEPLLKLREQAQPLTFQELPGVNWTAFIFAILGDDPGHRKSALIAGYKNLFSLNRLLMPLALQDGAPEQAAAILLATAEAPDSGPVNPTESTEVDQIEPNTTSTTPIRTSAPKSSRKKARRLTTVVEEEEEEAPPRKRSRPVPAIPSQDDTRYEESIQATAVPLGQQLQSSTMDPDLIELSGPVNPTESTEVDQIEPNTTSTTPIRASAPKSSRKKVRRRTTLIEEEEEEPPPRKRSRPVPAIPSEADTRYEESIQAIAVPPGQQLQSSSMDTDPIELSVPTSTTAPPPPVASPSSPQRTSPEDSGSTSSKPVRNTRRNLSFGQYRTMPRPKQTAAPRSTARPKRVQARQRTADFNAALRASLANSRATSAGVSPASSHAAEKDSRRLPMFPPVFPLTRRIKPNAEIIGALKDIIRYYIIKHGREPFPGCTDLDLPDLPDPFTRPALLAQEEQRFHDIGLKFDASSIRCTPLILLAEMRENYLNSFLPCLLHLIDLGLIKKLYLVLGKLLGLSFQNSVNNTLSGNSGMFLEKQLKSKLYHTHSTDPSLTLHPGTWFRSLLDIMPSVFDTWFNAEFKWSERTKKFANPPTQIAEDCRKALESLLNLVHELYNSTATNLTEYVVKVNPAIFNFKAIWFKLHPHMLPNIDNLDNIPHLLKDYGSPLFWSTQRYECIHTGLRRVIFYTNHSDVASEMLRRSSVTPHAPPSSNQ